MEHSAIEGETARWPSSSAILFILSVSNVSNARCLPLLWSYVEPAGLLVDEGVELRAGWAVFPDERKG